MDKITCPFCGEKDFDKIGLKHHLIVHCDEYDGIISIWEERELIAQRKLDGGPIRIR